MYPNWHPLRYSCHVGCQLLKVWCLVISWFCREKHGCEYLVIHWGSINAHLSLLKCVLKLTWGCSFISALAKAHQLLLDQQERDYITSQVTAAKGKKFFITFIFILVSGFSYLWWTLHSSEVHMKQKKLMRVDNFIIYLQSENSFVTHVAIIYIDRLLYRFGWNIWCAKL